MADDKIFKREIGSIAIDTEKINFLGSVIVKDISKNWVGFFKEPMPTLYTPSSLISHEGFSDFSIYFGRFEIIKGIFSCELVIIFSFKELLKFVETLEKISKSLNIADKKPLNSEIEEKDKKEKLKKAVLTMTNKTYFFSPNSYLIVSTGNELQFYFGRKVGQTNNKKTTLFVISTMMSIYSINDFINAIKENIKLFEEKTNTKLKDLTLNLELEEN